MRSHDVVPVFHIESFVGGYGCRHAWGSNSIYYGKATQLACSLYTRSRYTHTTLVFASHKRTFFKEDAVLKEGATEHKPLYIQYLGKETDYSMPALSTNTTKTCCLRPKLAGFRKYDTH